MSGTVDVSVHPPFLDSDSGPVLRTHHNPLSINDSISLILRDPVLQVDDKRMCKHKVSSLVWVVIIEQHFSKDKNNTILYYSILSLHEPNPNV